MAYCRDLLLCAALVQLVSLGASFHFVRESTGNAATWQGRSSGWTGWAKCSSLSLEMEEGFAEGKHSSQAQRLQPFALLVKGGSG